nr:MAG TPA: hypothetical protein [Crassvirales sp.]
MFAESVNIVYDIDAVVDDIADGVVDGVIDGR